MSARPSSTLALCALLATVALFPTRAEAQDSDADGVADAIDAYPCDGSAQATIFAPGEREHAMLLFEDLWPSNGDLDFNDVALTYNLALRVDTTGRALGVTATFNALALGGVLTNGLGWQLPVARGAVASVTRQLDAGAIEALELEPRDTNATVRLVPSLRALFDDAAGAINSSPSAARRVGHVLRVEVTFATPVELDVGDAPFDLFIFRTSDPSHEIHRPEYPGTAAMNRALFGTADDGSSGARSFVNRHGLPFVLSIPTLTEYPREAQSISDLFPGIVPFAMSGGTTNLDFYVANVRAELAYRDVGGHPRVDPGLLGTISPDRSCETPTCDDGRQNADETGVDCGGHCTIPEVCNGLDDDCNGTIDEGLGDVTCGVGRCAVTVEACTNGRDTVCTPLTPIPEQCNAIDDDCDGEVDETCDCVHGATQACYDGPSGTLGIGLCIAGAQTCTAGVWGPCDADVVPASERCNGIDEDCDGTADDGLGTITCGIGACVSTAAACVNGAAGTCVPGAPSAERCDDVDNDCDGLVDEGLGNVVCGIGACVREVYSCVAGAPNVCVPGAPSTELCDNVDNDCDGTTDEAEQSCAVPNGSGYQRCVPGGAAWASCTVTTCDDGYFLRNDSCNPPACDDGIMNGTEQNVDCGGNCRACLEAVADTVSVDEGESIAIAATTLLANDFAVAQGGAATIVSVDSAVGGTVTLAGTTVTFRSTGVNGQAASFRYTIRNTIGYEASGTVTVTVTLPYIEAIMVDTAADLAALTSAGTSYVPPTALQIFNTWQRFSHSPTMARPPASTTELTSWRYLSASDTVESTTNSTTYIGFISPESLSNYTMETTLTAGSAAGDNDAITVVVAYVAEGTPGTTGYREHTISAIRNRPASGDTHTQVGTTTVRWALVYNYNQSDERVLANGNATLTNATTAWSGNTTRTRIRIERRGDQITAFASNFGSDTIVTGSRLTYDLASSADTQRFSGPRPWGMGALSQANATFTNRVFSGGLNASVIHDATVSPARVLDYNTTTGTWVERAGATPQSVLGCPRGVNRPLISTITPNLPAASFYMTCSSITRQ
ncbi:LruC domain-containing protein [Myxococcota bacterium]|nr:LruC domain-containing protein [Myxococcota bacterium]